MKKFLSVLLFSYLYFFYGCDDVFPENISDNEVTTINPKEGDSITGSTVQFQWLTLEGADSYRLQVLDEQQIIVVDSSITGLFYTDTMEPGRYRWQIKGENSAYETVFSPVVNFSVIALSN